MGKIYVGNCSFDVTEQQLRDVFATYGEVSSGQRDHRSRQPVARVVSLSLRCWTARPRKRPSVASMELISVVVH